MQYTLSNDFLEIIINKKGAEMASLKNQKTGLEYLWQADPEVWGRHAPVLFPIVGQVKGGRYSYKGKTYNLSQHGFARDKNFEICEETAEKLSFKLVHDAETLQKYPFKFSLTISYILSQNTLKVVYEVYNSDREELLFSIGAHPGFKCPLEKGLEFSDYYLEFNQKETAERLLLEGPLQSGKRELTLKNETMLPLSYNQFDNDALIFDSLASDTVTLKSNKGQAQLQFNFEGFPYMAFWTKPGANAPFICLEPWYGIADHQETNGRLEEKTGIEKLSTDETFKSVYSITIS